MLAAGLTVGVVAAPATACYRDGYRYDRHGSYRDRSGYDDDDCDSDGYYCDGYGWYRDDDRDYRYHRRYYRDGGACVFHEAVGAVTFDFLCSYR